MSENYINHIAMVLDASGSMRNIASQTAQVADQQIAELAQRSKELDQETRISVYTFDDRVECLIYDKDVLRMPSIQKLYSVGGQTALIDATLKALSDLSKTPELYGEHSFLMYVLTDGGENASHQSPVELQRQLLALKDHWTVACFVPNAVGVAEAKRFGFAKDNIAIWDPSAKGIEEAGKVIRQTTSNYMNLRSTGFRGSKNLFNLSTDNLYKGLKTALLTPLHPGQYRTYDVKQESDIASFVERATRRTYKLGEAFYELTKPEKVQPQKQVAIMDRKKYTLYTGADARKLLSLPNFEVKVNPASTPDYSIFIQSTSVNRKLVPGTRVLVMSA